MLPDYPESKARLRELLTHPLAMAQQAGIFSQMKTRRMFEGHRMGIVREDGSVDVSGLQNFKSELKIELKDIESMTTADILQKMLGQARELHFKKSKAMFEKLHEENDGVGNALNLQGRPLTPELFLEHFRRIQIGFEEDGKPRMPTILCGQEAAKIFQRIMQKIEEDPSLKSEFARIMDEKRRAWLDRESSRKLVG